MKFVQGKYLLSLRGKTHEDCSVERPMNSVQGKRTMKSVQGKTYKVCSGEDL